MTYKKKSYQKFVATAATATLVASAIVPAVSAASFPDVEEKHEFAQYINAAVDAGYIKGYADGTFGINDNLKRSQVVIIIGRYLEDLGYTSEATTSPWSDVTDAEVIKYGNIVKDAGVFTGYANGTLNGNAFITRENMAVVLDRLAKTVTDISLSELAAEIEDVKIADLATANADYRDAIQALRDLEISTADNFNPKGNVKRGQFAKFIINSVEAIEAISEVITAEDIAKEIAAVDATLPAVADIKADNAEAAKATVEAAKEAIAAIKEKIQVTGLTGEEVAELNKAIEAVEAKYAAIVEAADKAIAATKELVVESVSAINATEIKVTFNQELNKDSAQTATNYEVFVNAGAATNKLTATTDYTVELQNDKKSVIIKLKTAKHLENGNTVKVNAKNILNSNYQKVTDFTGEFAIFNDKSAPKVVGTSLSGNILSVTFDKPVERVGSVRVDGTTVATNNGFYSDSTRAGKYTVEYVITDTAMLASGNHKVVVYAAQDFNGNVADMISSTYDATANNVKPSIEKVEALSTNKFRVTFASPVVAPVDANFVIKKGNYTFTDTEITAVQGTTNRVWDVEITTASTSVNPLYAVNESSVNLSVQIKDFKGTNNVFGDTYSTSLTLTKDTVKPTVQNANINTANGQVLTVIFTEELASADSAKISITKDGVRIPVQKAVVNSTDAKKLDITVDSPHTVSDGTYNVGFAADAVKDLANNGNDAINTSVLATVVAGSAIQPSTVAVGQVNGQNKLTITYPEKMTGSAVDLANYKLDGVPLNNALYAGANIAFTNDTKTVVEIILPKGEVSSSAYTALLEISKNVKSEAGKVVATTSKETFTVHPTGTWADDVAPTLQVAEYVKGSSVDASSNLIKLTFSENVTASDVNDFLVTTGSSNTKVPVKSIQTTANGKEVVLVLSTSVNLTQATTVAITEDKAHNLDGQINIVDGAQNKATAKALTIAGQVVDGSIVNTSAVTEAQNALALVNLADASTIAKAQAAINAIPNDGDKATKQKELNAKVGEVAPASTSEYKAVYTGFDTAGVNSLTVSQEGQNIKLTGTSNAVTGFTGFNPSEVAEQKGNYVPFTLVAPTGLTTVSSGKPIQFKVDGGTSWKSGTTDADNKIFFIKRFENAAAVKSTKMTVEVDWNNDGTTDATYIIDFSGVKFE